MIVQRNCTTWWAKIFVGLRAGRTTRIRDVETVHNICRWYCNDVGLCVTVTPTTFIYTGSSEPGAIVGLINYPRFQKTPGQIREVALDLAHQLRSACEQWGVSVMFPDETILLSGEEVDHPQSAGKNGGA